MWKKDQKAKELAEKEKDLRQRQKFEQDMKKFYEKMEEYVRDIDKFNNYLTAVDFASRCKVYKISIEVTEYYKDY